MGKVFEMTSTVVGAILIRLITVVITSFFGAMAWNHVMPDMFGMKEITYMQFFCLSFVANMLIKIQSTYSSK